MFFGHMYVFFEGMFVYTLCLLFYGIVYLTKRCMSYWEGEGSVWELEDSGS